MELSAVFFDLDGVLVDSFEANLALLNGVARNFGYPNIDSKVAKELFATSIEEAIKEHYPEIKNYHFGKYMQSNPNVYFENLQENKGAKELLDNLEMRGIHSAVITNANSAVARDILETKNLLPNILVGAGDEYRAKPAPDMIFRACELLNVPPWEVLFVGDSSKDRDAAMAAGCLFAGFGITGNFTIRELSEVLPILEGAGPSS